MKYKLSSLLRNRVGRVKLHRGEPNPHDTSAPSTYAITKLVKKLKVHFKKHRKPHFFAASGYSGCAIGTVLSYEFDIPLIFLRNGHLDRLGYKDRESKKAAMTRELCVNTYNTFIDYKNKTYIFTDDLIDTGTTFGRIFYHLQKLDMKCTGVALTDGIFMWELKEFFANKKGPKLFLIEAKAY